MSLFIERQYNDGSVKVSKQDTSSSGDTSNPKETAKGGVIDDLTHEQILSYLEKIEGKLRQNEVELLSRRGEKDLVYPYRERYLEYVVNNNSEYSDKYQTDLAELYIEGLFRIQEKEKKDEVLVPHLINPGRKKLI